MVFWHHNRLDLAALNLKLGAAIKDNPRTSYSLKGFGAQDSGCVIQEYSSEHQILTSVALTALFSLFECARAPGKTSVWVI